MSSDKPILLSAPVIGGNEWTYVKECLDTAWVSSVGPFVGRFEQEFAAYLGIPYGVACQSGTAALHVSLIVGGVVPGDEVIVPNLTFIAPANAITYVGAAPVLCDVVPQYGLLDLDLVEDFLRNECRTRGGATYNRVTGARVSAVIPVHVLGNPIDMNRLMSLANEFGLVVVEDATESLGSSYKGRATGTVGHIGCFSFNGNKIMTTGGGGMIVTADAKWAHRAKHISHQAKVDPVEYHHDEVGFNYRMTNMQAALGVAQLERMGEFVQAKRRIAARYIEAFAAVPGLIPIGEPDWAKSNCWLFTVLVDQDKFSVSSRVLMKSIGKDSIQSRPLWRPLHLGPPHRGCQLIGSGQGAERLYALALSLPCSTDLTPEQQERVIGAVANAARL